MFDLFVIVGFIIESFHLKIHRNIFWNTEKMSGDVRAHQSFKEI